MGLVNGLSQQPSTTNSNAATIALATPATVQLEVGIERVPNYRKELVLLTASAAAGTIAGLSASLPITAGLGAATVLAASSKGQKLIQRSIEFVKEHRKELAIITASAIAGGILGYNIRYVAASLMSLFPQPASQNADHPILMLAPPPASQNADHPAARPAPPQTSTLDQPCRARSFNPFDPYSKHITPQHPTPTAPRASDSSVRPCPPCASQPPAAPTPPPAAPTLPPAAPSPLATNQTHPDSRKICPTSPRYDEVTERLRAKYHYLFETASYATKFGAASGAAFTLITLKIARTIAWVRGNLPHNGLLGI